MKNFYLILSWLAGISSLIVLSQYNYLIFHTAVELFCVVVAFSLFLLIWNARTIVKNDYFLVLGAAFLSAGLLDLLHLLTYQGIALIPGIDANIPTQLWIASRYILAISFLLGPLAFYRKLNASLVFLGYIFVTLLIFAAIFEWGIFPDSYVQGTGLTTFKIASEYIIILIFIAAGLILYHLRERFDRSVLRLILLSLALSVVAELLFTLYVGVYDTFNMLGHLAKILAYYFVYRAVVGIGLIKPYNLLFFELNKANLTKDDYMRILSHELKTPLTSIKLYSEVLAQKYDDEFIKNIESQADRMNRLINDLSDISKLESGKIKFQMAEIDLGQLLAKAVADYRMLYPEYNFELKISEGNVLVRGDFGRLQQVVSNLLNNAIKYSGESKKIAVMLGVEGREAKVSVQDFGIGIPADKQKVIFEKYYRTDQGEKLADGVGLGLHIAREIITRHNGEIAVLSQDGKGSTFYFTLPLV